MDRRRVILNAIENSDDVLVATGEIQGAVQKSIIIEHNLGKIPLIFAIYTEDDITDTASGTVSEIVLNTGRKTRYTSTVSKQWSEIGTIIATDGVNEVANIATSSTSYGIWLIDDEKVELYKANSSSNFISGKTYKWIAIAMN